MASAEAPKRQKMVQVESLMQSHEGRLSYDACPRGMGGVVHEADDDELDPADRRQHVEARFGAAPIDVRARRRARR